MIKFLSGLVLTFSILFVSVSETKAQSKSESLSATLEKQKSEARIMISRTAMVVLEVQKQVKSGKVLKGDFADAVNHARYAVQLFQSGKFRHAAMHAELARRLAVKASVANNGKLETTKISLNEEEKSVLFGPKVEDGELLYEVKKLLKLKPAVSEDNLVNSDLSDLTSAKLNTVLK